MRRIEYENFRTEVSEPIKVPTENGLKEVIVLSMIDVDSATVHQFAYPVGPAAEVGAAMQGKRAPKVEPVSAAAMRDISKIVPPPGA